MPSPAGQTHSVGSMPVEERDRFCEDLADGLHAMAQPLTILRSALEVLTLRHGTGIDQRRYLDMSAEQVKRTCDLFSCLQDLVSARMIDAERATVDPWELMAPIIEDKRSVLQATGVEIAVARPGPWEPVFGDAERTKQALSAVLTVAGAFSSRGDVIELLAFHRNGFFELTVHNRRRHGKQMNSSDRLSLSVAEANVLSQYGRFHCAEDPFCVAVALPVQDLGAVKSDLAFTSTRAEQLH